MILSPSPKQHFFGNNGRPLEGGLLFTYLAGTSTKVATYLNEAGTPNTNPVVLDFRGEANLWLDPEQTYKYVLAPRGDTDPPTNPIWSVDDIEPGLTLSSITREIIGRLLYPRTPAEISAGVTPTLYYFPPNDVRRYGATGDGITDDTAAILRARDVGRYSGVVYFPSANDDLPTIYLTTGEIFFYERTLVYGDGPSKVTLQMDSNTAFLNIFDCASSFDTPINLSTNASAGANTVTVASLGILAVGQLVEIYDETFKFGAIGKNLELNEIIDISGSGPFTITLANRLIFDYLTGRTAAIKAATQPSRGIIIEGLNFYIPVGKDGGGIIYQDSYACQINNCTCTGPNSQAGFTFWRSAYCTAINLEVQDGQNVATPAYGYGFSMGASTHNCVVSDSTFRSVRENAVADNVRYSGYVNCQAVSPYDNGFNAHALGASDCFFDNCRVYFSQSKGFYCGGVTAQAADVRIKFTNCQVHYCGYLAYWADGVSGIESEDIIFENCSAYNYGTTTAASYGFYAFHSIRPRIINCSVDANGVSNARACAKMEDCTDAVLRGGSYRGATAGWGIIHSNCTGVIIDDASIGEIGSAQGVQAEGTPSTKVYVRRNKVDNDTAFTKNSGDIIEFNEYATKRQNSRGSTASVADGGTVTHGCVSTPYSVRISPTIASQMASVTAVGTTTFTVAIKTDAGSAGSSQTIYWEADS